MENSISFYLCLKYLHHRIFKWCIDLTEIYRYRLGILILKNLIKHQKMAIYIYFFLSFLLCDVSVRSTNNYLAKFWVLQTMEKKSIQAFAMITIHLVSSCSTSIKHFSLKRQPYIPILYIFHICWKISSCIYGYIFMLYIILTQ